MGEDAVAIFTCGAVSACILFPLVVLMMRFILSTNDKITTEGRSAAAILTFGACATMGCVFASSINDWTVDAGDGLELAGSTWGVIIAGGLTCIIGGVWVIAS